MEPLKDDALSLNLILFGPKLMGFGTIHFNARGPTWESGEAEESRRVLLTLQRVRVGTEKIGYPSRGTFKRGKNICRH